MSDEQIALARRAVACPGWRWMPGMLTSFNARHLGRHLWVDQGSSVVVYADQNEGEVPDLTDPATLGCLLALVREAHGQPLVSVKWSIDGWRVINTEGKAWCWRIAKGASEAEALVAALEAAPCGR